MESSLLFLKLAILNNKMAPAPNRFTQSKYFTLQAHPQIKFEDESLKKSLLIVCIGLALAPFFCLKWLQLKIKQNMP